MTEDPRNDAVATVSVRLTPQAARNLAELLRLLDEEAAPPAGPVTVTLAYDAQAADYELRAALEGLRLRLAVENLESDLRAASKYLAPLPAMSPARVAEWYGENAPALTEKGEHGVRVTSAVAATVDAIREHLREVLDDQGLRLGE